MKNIEDMDLTEVHSLLESIQSKVQEMVPDNVYFVVLICETGRVATPLLISTVDESTTKKLFRHVADCIEKEENIPTSPPK